MKDEKMLELKELPDDGFLRKDRQENQGEFPIFILGTGRCGSTLMQKIINSVDDAMIYGEHGGFLKDIAKAYFLNLENEKIEKYIMSKNASGKDPESVSVTLRNPRLWTAWTNWYNKEAVQNNFRDFIDSFFNPASLKRKVHWGFKEIRYGPDDRVMEMLADLYPTARFIFIVRHPVDVVASKLSVRMSDGIEADAHNWTEQNSFFLRFHHETSDRSAIIRYEDLINKDGQQLKLLFDWLGFSLSEKQSDTIETTRPSEEEGPKRKSLDNAEVNKIKKITHKVRLELGY